MAANSRFFPVTTYTLRNPKIRRLQDEIGSTTIRSYRNVKVVCAKRVAKLKYRISKNAVLSHLRNPTGNVSAHAHARLKPTFILTLFVSTLATTMLKYGEAFVRKMPGTEILFRMKITAADRRKPISGMGAANTDSVGRLAPWE